MFNQTLKDIEHIYRDVAGYDMNYDEFKELCRKSWDEDYNYLFCIDRSEKGAQGKCCICNESKKNLYRSNTSDETILIIIQKCNLFQKQKWTMFSNLLNVIFK